MDDAGGDHWVVPSFVRLALPPFVIALPYLGANKWNPMLGH